MTKELDEGVSDELLENVTEAITPLRDPFLTSEDHAILTIAVRYHEETDSEPESVETVIQAAGYFGILGEGLYSELYDEIQNGNPQLFKILRDVIHDLEDDLDIAHDEDFGIKDEDDDSSNGRTLH